jgi:hypothetical protein
MAQNMYTKMKICTAVVAMAEERSLPAARAIEISPILPYFKIKLVAESRIYERAH